MSLLHFILARRRTFKIPWFHVCVHYVTSTRCRNSFTLTRRRLNHRVVQVRRCWEFFVVDGHALKHSNWMRDVNYAPSRRRRNLVGIVSGGDIFYRTLREIGVGEELLVGYSRSFADSLLGTRRRPGAPEPGEKLVLHFLIRR